MIMLIGTVWATANPGVAHLQAMNTLLIGKDRQRLTVRTVISMRVIINTRGITRTIF